MEHLKGIQELESNGSGEALADWQKGSEIILNIQTEYLESFWDRRLQQAFFWQKC